jgi:hypothetical protein
MHVEDMKDPAEVQPPGRNRVFVAFCEEKTRNCVTFTLLDDLPLNVRHGATITCIAGQQSKPRTAGSTHIVNWFIASHTD